VLNQPTVRTGDLLARSTIVYADFDQQRLRKTSETLTAAGYTVWPCSGSVPVPSPVAFGTPDLVLLGPEFDKRLTALAATLWPEVSILVLNDSEDYSQLLARIASALPKRGSD
jgi:hypothetical protein